MKKIVLIMLFATIESMCIAQINQITSISNNLIFSGADANKYYSYQTNGNVISIYNWNGSLYKTISITPPSGYHIHLVTSLSKKIINNDDKLEMCVTFVSSTTSDNSFQKMWLINEDGTKLNDFGSAFLISSNYSSYNGETHLNIFKTMTNPTSYNTIIYQCSGSVNIVQQNGIDLRPAFPNPATNIITLPYQLKNKATSQINIYDASGHLYTAIPVGSHFNEVKIDVSNYPSGIYIYECEGISNKFIVQ